MRYVHLNKIPTGEKESRRRFLKEIFNLYFYELKGKSNIEFISFPPFAYDALIIYGHNFAVQEYLEKHNNIKEKNIILVTCRQGIIIPKKYKKRNIYISKSETSTTNYYNGKEYGFEFNITDTEIFLYRHRNKDFITQINKALERM